MKTGRDKLYKMYNKVESLQTELTNIVKEVLRENNGNVKEKAEAVKIANHSIAGMEIKEVGLNATSNEIIAYIKDGALDCSRYVQVTNISGLYNVIGFLINNADYLKDKIDFFKTIEPGDVISATIDRTVRFVFRYAGFRLIGRYIQIYHNGALKDGVLFKKSDDADSIIVYAEDVVEYASMPEIDSFLKWEEKSIKEEEV